MVSSITPTRIIDDDDNGSGWEDGKWCEGETPPAHGREFEFCLRVVLLVNQLLCIGCHLTPSMSSTTGSLVKHAMTLLKGVATPLT